MRWWLAVWCWLVGVVVASAAVVNGDSVPSGTLASAQAATGVSANSVRLRKEGKKRWLFVTYRNTAGTAALQLEVNCTGAATDWVAVPSSGKSLTVGADGAAVEQPACEYRTNVTACTACAVTAIYDVGSEIQ